MSLERCRASDGIQLAFQYDDFTEPGSDSPYIVLQHEFPFNSNFWYGWVPRLGIYLRIVRPDLRGLGRSHIPLRVYNPSIDLFVRDVIDLIDHLGVDQVVWVGVGTGNLIGITLAAQHPTRVSALVLCDSQTYVHSEHLNEAFDKEKKGDAIWFGPQAPESFLRHGMREYARWANRNWPLLQGRPPAFLEWLEEQVAFTDNDLAHKFYSAPEGAAGVDCRPLLKDVKTPTLLLNGSLGGANTRSDHEYTLAQLPNAEEVVFDGSSFQLYHSQPERCTREVKKFLAKHGVLPSEALSEPAK